MPRPTHPNAHITLFASHISPLSEPGRAVLTRLACDGLGQRGEGTLVDGAVVLPSCLCGGG
jgi:hypothetical protein